MKFIDIFSHRNPNRILINIAHIQKIVTYGNVIHIKFSDRPSHQTIQFDSEKEANDFVDKVKRKNDLK